MLGTTIKTPFRWRIAVFGEHCWAESAGETRLIVRRAGKDDPEVIDYPHDNHLGRNFDAASLRGNIVRKTRRNAPSDWRAFHKEGGAVPEYR